MEHEHLLVWLEAVSDADIAGPTRAASSHIVRSNLLCRRHAEAMVVPRGWTLDDRRELRPRLFKVIDSGPSPATAKTARNAKSRGASTGAAESQLSFDQLDRAEELIDAVTVGEIRPTGEVDPDETQALPWRPVFDAGDDLGGLLTATSPLLSRAFNGRNRTDQ